MRAEEGDETIKDYADEGEQTMHKIKDAQDSSANPLTRIGQRLSKLLPGGSGH